MDEKRDDQQGMSNPQLTKVRYVVRRTRTQDRRVAVEMGFESSAVGAVKESKKFKTRDQAQREADAWQESGDWTATVEEVK